MTINRKAFQTPPKVWHEVPWVSKGPRSWARREEAKKWCHQHAGVFGGDWLIGYSIKEKLQAPYWKFKFRDAKIAMLFRLTWV